MRRPLIVGIVVGAVLASTASSASASDGVQAAVRYHWGPVVAGDEFNYTGAPDATKWNVYSGPGNQGKGIRTPAAWKVAKGVATVTGLSNGTTGGMSANFGRRKYGRWETRMRSSVRDPKYHPVLLLWPDAGPGATCPEVDYGEAGSDPTLIHFHLHYGCAPRQVSVAKTVDATHWHNYAVQWTAKGIIGYIDGVKWFSDTNPAHQPPGSMHQTVQLDWFPDGTATRKSTMSVAWVRVYNVR